MSISVVIADPYPVMLDGLSRTLAAEPGVEVQACVRDGDAALSAVMQHEPDILVLDLNLPGKNGLALLQDLQASGLRTRPLVFTGAPIRDVVRAIDLGVRGLVAKDKSGQTLQRCLHTVHQGGQWLDKDLTMMTVNHLLGREKRNGAIAKLLTAREITVAKMVTEGWPNKKIASKLCISEGTTKLHLHHIYQKLNCSGRMGLMLYMQENGLN